MTRVAIHLCTSHLRSFHGTPTTRSPSPGGISQHPGNSNEPCCEIIPKANTITVIRNIPTSPTKTSRQLEVHSTVTDTTTYSFDYVCPSNLDDALHTTTLTPLLEGLCEGNHKHRVCVHLGNFAEWPCVQKSFEYASRMVWETMHSWESKNTPTREVVVRSTVFHCRSNRVTHLTLRGWGEVSLFLNSSNPTNGTKFEAEDHVVLVFTPTSHTNCSVTLVRFACIDTQGPALRQISRDLHNLIAVIAPALRRARSCSPLVSNGSLSPGASAPHAESLTVALRQSRLWHALRDGWLSAASTEVPPSRSEVIKADSTLMFVFHIDPMRHNTHSNTSLQRERSVVALLRKAQILYRTFNRSSVDHGEFADPQAFGVYTTPPKMPRDDENITSTPPKSHVAHLSEEKSSVKARAHVHTMDESVDAHNLVERTETHNRGWTEDDDEKSSMVQLKEKSGDAKYLGYDNSEVGLKNPWNKPHENTSNPVMQQSIHSLRLRHSIPLFPQRESAPCPAEYPSSQSHPVANMSISSNTTLAPSQTSDSVTTNHPNYSTPSTGRRPTSPSPLDGIGLVASDASTRANFWRLKYRAYDSEIVSKLGWNLSQGKEGTCSDEINGRSTAESCEHLASCEEDWRVLQRTHHDDRNARYPSTLPGERSTNLSLISKYLDSQHTRDSQYQRTIEQERTNTRIQTQRVAELEEKIRVLESEHRIAQGEWERVSREKCDEHLRRVDLFQCEITRLQEILMEIWQTQDQVRRGATLRCDACGRTPESLLTTHVFPSVFYFSSETPRYAERSFIEEVPPSLKNASLRHHEERPMPARRADVQSVTRLPITPGQPDQSCTSITEIHPDASSTTLVGLDVSALLRSSLDPNIVHGRSLPLVLMEQLRENVNRIIAMLENDTSQPPNREINASHVEQANANSKQDNRFFKSVAWNDRKRSVMQNVRVCEDLEYPRPHSRNELGIKFAQSQNNYLQESHQPSELTQKRLELQVIGRSKRRQPIYYKK